MKKRVGKITAVTVLGLSGAIAQVSVDINLDTRHEVGGVSELDRETYFVLHAGAGENTWDSEAQETAFLTENDVYLGRANGTLPWNLSQTTEDPSKPGWCNHADMLSRGNSARSNYASDTHAHSLESRARKMMIGGQEGMYPNGQTNGNGFAIGSYEALADYYEQFLTDFYGSGGTDGAPKPAMVEVLNEPFVKADELGTTRANISRLHTNVAAAIHHSHPDVLVGGYCAAHPQYEGSNFGHWEANWKTFIDIAGEHMDFFSLHLYDNPGGSTNVLEHQYRSGSNVEALLDMIEHYSMLTLGEIKPFNISEYGSLSVESDVPYDPKNDWVDVRSYSTILMQLLERPDRMIQTIPFMMVQAEWGRSANGYPYPTRLLYDEDELLGSPKDKDGPFVFTERIKYWQLWNEVRGTRVDTISDDPDIQVDAYVDETNAFVIVSSLDHTGPQTVELNLFGTSRPFEAVEVKHTYADTAGNVVLDHYVTNELAALTLPASSTAVINYQFSDPVVPEKTSVESKYYATTYLQPISAGVPIEFSITNVNVSARYGDAVLRLGAGRAHGLSLKPVLTVNGAEVPVPDDWRGYDQATRDSFFGVLEIPVPYELLQSNNTVSVEFPDNGGHISSVALQTFRFESDIRTRAKMIPIDSAMVQGSEFLMEVTDGPANGWIELHAVTNLVSGNWMVQQQSLPTDAAGQSVITNRITAPQEFYRIVEGSAPGIPVSGFAMEPDVGSVSTGGTFRLLYRLSPDDAADKRIIWSSSDPAVATVSGGIVTALSSGSAIITGETVDGGFTDSCSISVGSTAADIVFDDVNKYRNQQFTNGTYLTVKTEYQAGAGHTVLSPSDGISYKLRQIDASAGPWSVVQDYTAEDAGAAGTAAGASEAQIWIPEDIIPSDQLPADNFYYLFASFNSTDGGSESVGTQPVIIENPNWIPVITFTAPDYGDGPLDGQQLFAAESGWTVSNSTGSGMAFTPDNQSAAILTNAVQLGVGETYHLTINMEFSGTYSTPTAWAYVFLAGMKESQTASSVGTAGTAADANIQIYTGEDKYRLLNEYSGIGASTIANTLDAGDILQFEYQLTLGVDAASTSYTVRLQNLTDGDDTGIGTVNGVDDAIYNALTGSGAYGFFQSHNLTQSDVGFDGLQVNSVTVTLP
ncbi:Ig-like domain-containing protein [Pontiella agarivorans]|uniref:Ig-like domain-containing protein n=1 Tax=Pontiella agarivorans TaxID=3038953 RepID=A0ABU5MUD9_9BACT|nr:Ig-like domain-containing protein [Pontiella agarivorans]MDZ8117790.1 Ig-like domain-containing protein [Pontiella agarivorans]